MGPTVISVMRGFMDSLTANVSTKMSKNHSKMTIVTNLSSKESLPK